MCHCDFALSDGRRFGAWTGQTRFYTSAFGADREVFRPANLSPETLLLWLQKEDGGPFDYPGVSRFALTFLHASKDKWFFSELAAVAIPHLTGWQIDPAKASLSTIS